VNGGPIEPERLQGLRRQVHNDDVGGLDQLLHDLAAFGVRGIERQALLVAVHLQEHGAFARRPVGVMHDRDQGAVFRAVALFDADDLSTHVAQKRSAIGARDIAPEIEHPDSVENCRHLSSLGMAVAPT